MSSLFTVKTANLRPEFHPGRESGNWCPLYKNVEEDSSPSNCPATTFWGDHTLERELLGPK